MRVFVAGASGAIGTRLVPQLVDRGHEVIGSPRSAENAEHIRALGAEPVALDLLDRAAVKEAHARRIDLTTMGEFWIEPGSGPPTLLVGYGQVIAMRALRQRPRAASRL